MCITCKTAALPLFVLRRVCSGFIVAPFKQSENLSPPPRVQENKYARLVILLQLSLPADRVTWSSEARRLAF